MRSFVVLFALLIAAETPADACPAGSPCTKYKQRVVQVKPTTYMRVSGGVLRSFTRARIVAFLTGARWDPVTAPASGAQVAPRANVRQVAPDPIVFTEADKAVRMDPRQARFHVRPVLVRRIEFKDGAAMIDVDNDLYVLERCAGKQRMCLTLRNDLSFESLENEPGFSQPPASP